MALWFGCTWLWSLPLRAEPVLAWHAPTECPAAHEVEEEIARLLGRPLARVAIELSATVHIRGNSRAGFQATVSLDGGPRSRPRVLRDPRCEALAHAAIVVIALAIDPSTQPQSGASQPGNAQPPAPASGAANVDASAAIANEAGVVQPPAAAAAASGAAAKAVTTGSSVGASALDTVSPPGHSRSPSPAPASAPGADTPASAIRAASELHPYVGAAVAIGAGPLPSPAPAIAASCGLLGKHWRAALRIFYAPPRSVTLENPDGAGGRVGLLAGAAEGGLRLSVSMLEFPLLGGFEVGAFQARGEGVPEVESTHPLWLAGYLASGMAVAWRGRFAVGLRVEGVISLHRPRFAVQSDLGEAYVFYQPERLGVRGLLEAELRLR